jgi:hypothetical protein
MAAMRLRWHKWWLVALASTACTLNPQPDLPLRPGGDSSNAGASGSGANTSTGSGASEGGSAGASVPAVGEAGATEGAAEAGAGDDAGASNSAPIVAR